MIGVASHGSLSFPEEGFSGSALRETTAMRTAIKLAQGVGKGGGAAANNALKVAAST